MKPLNRPMFRYGGPIKEGVMSGIREPKKDGGAMGINKPKRGLVNEPGSYAGFLALGVPAALTALRVGARRAIPKIANFFRTQTGTKSVPKQGPTLTLPGKTVYKGGYSGKVPGKTVGPGTAEVPVYSPNYLGRDPTVKLIGGLYKGATSPTATGVLSKAAKFATSPTVVVGGGLYYINGKFFNEKGDEVKDKDKIQKAISEGGDGPPGGGDPNMRGDGSYFAEQEANRANEVAKERMAANKKKYYEIMGIDKMGREATGDALINASRAINELNTQGIGLKEGLKTGKLQNLVIEGISSAMDKPAKTRQAVDAAILKAEINKEMNKDQTELANMLRAKQIEGLDRAAKEDSLEGDLKAYFTKNGAFPSGQQLSQIARIRGVDIAGVESDITAVNEHISKGGDEVSYMQEIIAQGGDVPPGIHVIGSRLIAVGEDMKVTAVL